jgi:hypothetical protein
VVANMDEMEKIEDTVIENSVPDLSGVSVIDLLTEALKKLTCEA